MTNVIPALPGAPAVVLASNSATRARLLRGAGLAIEVAPATIDESAVLDSLRADGAGPADAAELLAAMKAETVSARRREALVVGADQLLVCGDAWYEKPRNRADARAQLLALAGRAHVLHTAVVVARGGARIWHHVASPRLVMRALSPAFLEAYLDAAGEAVLGSVGAYQLEGLGAQLFERVEGDWFAVLGLPLLPLLGFLRQHGAVAA